MNAIPRVAELSAPSREHDSAERLSVFLRDGEMAPLCLVDPALVSEFPASGHWRLLAVDESRACAYYARIDHSRIFGCELSAE